ncbi:MAG: hypothetical protein HY711_08085 [Candidatus Melainabacteria bacterium]|nr:hypothetical protein [Candidatus Melainabacteria bacterium]
MSLNPQTGNGQTTDATQAGLSPASGQIPAPASTITVNVGVPGNIRKLVLEGNKWSVKDVLNYAEINASGYDLRVGGQPVNLDSPVADGQTILLLRAVRGN